MAGPDADKQGVPPDDGALHQKVLIGGVLVLFVLIFVIVGFLVATRQ